MKKFIIFSLLVFSTTVSAQVSKDSCDIALKALNHAEAFVSETEMKLWIAYWKDRSDSNRNALIEHFRYLTGIHAKVIWRRVPKGQISLEELESAGVDGLINSISGFIVEKNIKFTTYSALKIRGAILDYLREIDVVPRLARERNGIASTAELGFFQENGYFPTEEELRARLIRLKFAPAKIDKIIEHRKIAEFVSGDKAVVAGDSKDVSIFDVLRGSGSGPLMTTARAEGWKKLLAPFTRTEMMIITLYYREDLTMFEIGKVVDLSESRVSQFHASVLDRLKSRYSEEELRELLILE